MTVAYWVLAGLLAALYLYSGALKLLRSKDQLRPVMGWVDSMPLAMIRAIGGLEVLGALGLILPPLTGIAPGLSLVAATGLLLLQIGAIALHLRRGEARLIGLNIGVLAVTGIVIWLATIWV